MQFTELAILIHQERIQELYQQAEHARRVRSIGGGQAHPLAHARRWLAARLGKRTPLQTSQAQACCPA